MDCMRLKEMSIGWAPHVDKCSLQCLQLIQRVLYRQHGFLYRRELSSGRVMSFSRSRYNLISVEV